MLCIIFSSDYFDHNCTVHIHLHMIYLTFAMSCFGCFFGCIKCLIVKCIRFWKKFFGFGKTSLKTQIISEKCSQTDQAPFHFSGRKSVRVEYCDNLCPKILGRQKVLETCYERRCVPVHHILTNCSHGCAYTNRRKRAKRRGIQPSI